MKKRIVSIIVPCYNVEKYISKCLNSIINQTFKDIEIICVNDGSTDDTLKKLKSFKDERIKIIDKTNGGVSSARNSGIEHASGEYIMFIDGDDYVDVEMVEKMFKTAKENDADIVKCNRNDVYEDKNVIIKRLPIWKDKKIINKKEFSKYVYPEFFGRSRLCNAFMTLIKRKLINDNNIKFSNKLVVDEDEIFSIEIFQKAKKFVYIPENYYFYVKNTNGLSGSGVNIYDRVVSRKEHIKLLKDYSKKWKLDNYSHLLIEKTAFIGIYTAMQTAFKSTKYSKKEQYKLFKIILNDDTFKSNIKKSNMEIMIFTEKILCFFVKIHFYHIGFYYSRLIGFLKNNLRYKLEKFRKNIR